MLIGQLEYLSPSREYLSPSRTAFYRKALLGVAHWGRITMPLFKEEHPWPLISLPKSKLRPETVDEVKTVMDEYAAHVLSMDGSDRFEVYRG